MKLGFTFLLSITFYLLVSGQNNYKESIEQGNKALKEGDYRMALNKYFAAEAFDPTMKDSVKEEINRIFITIDSLKAKALKDRDRAINAEKRATESLTKADNLVNAFYFYADRFALAFNGKFYYIDKNGNKIPELGEWESAEQFQRNGLAKVKDTNKKDYIIDTSGMTYKVSYNIDDVNEEVRALDLSNKKLESLPLEIFNFKS